MDHVDYHHTISKNGVEYQIVLVVKLAKGGARNGADNWKTPRTGRKREAAIPQLSHKTDCTMTIFLRDPVTDGFEIRLSGVSKANLHAADFAAIA